MKLSEASSLLPETAIKGASTVPAYALVIVVNGLIVIAVMTTDVRLELAILVVVSVLVLSFYVVWVVELRSRRSVATTSAAQTERLEEVRDLDTPIRCVFEDLVGDDDVYVVYSSTEVREFVNQLGATVRPDDPTYGGSAEKRVTTIPDAIGAARIHNLLYLGGKRQRLRTITSWPGDFRGEHWEASLILIGSGKSNRATTEALDRFDSPYRFSEQFDALVDARSPGARWPADASELRTTDYGIVVKFKVERSGRTNVYLVVAGVGPYGTLAGCVFLERQVEKICGEYDRSPFAYLLSVRRDDLSYFDPRVERHCALPVARG